MVRNARSRRKSIHHNADPGTAELLFRIITSVNQLSVCGAVADWCEELAQQIADLSSTGTRNPVAKVNNESESQVAPTDVSILSKSPLTSVLGRGNSV